MNRIRYTQPDYQGLLWSVKNYNHYSSGSSYQVKLDINNMTFEIVDRVAEKVAQTGSAPSLHRLKQKAKKALIDLGIEFDAEERIKRQPTVQVEEEISA